MTPVVLENRPTFAEISAWPITFFAVAQPLESMATTSSRFVLHVALGNSRGGPSEYWPRALNFSREPPVMAGLIGWT
ncbi:MAG: hypothetical protein ABI641_11435 [Caldimonas sp.]